LGADLVVAAGFDGLEKISKDQTRVIVNTHESITGHFTQNAGAIFPSEAMKAELVKAAGKERVDFVEASSLATALMGDSIATNLFLVGYALQRGHIPVSSEAIMEAIRLNGVSVSMNVQAFQWGRLAAVDLAAVEGYAKKEVPVEADHVLSASLQERIQRRYDFLVGYQDEAYANRYLSFVQNVAKEEERLGLTRLAEAAAESYYRLLAVKDEYEVARLYTNGDFIRRLTQQFEGDFKLHFHLAPPLLARRDPHTGELKKKTYGPWFFKILKFLAKRKGLRRSIFNIFRYTSERRMERQMVADFEITMGKILAQLSWKNHSVACEIIELPQSIHGFGHIKERTLKAAREAEKALWEKMKAI